YWNLYIAVALSGIGFLASGKLFAQQARIKLVLTVGFVVFALSNLNAMLCINHQRQALLKMIDSHYLLAANPAVGPPDCPMVGVDFTRGQRFGCIPPYNGFRYKRARTMAAGSNHDAQQLTAERFLFLQGAGPYSEGNDLAKVKLFSTRLIEVWTAGHDRWANAIEHQKAA